MFTPNQPSSYIKLYGGEGAGQSDANEGDDEMNQKALRVLERVSNKLSGRTATSFSQISFSWR